MPPLPKLVKYHPSSVDNLLVQSLVDRTSINTFKAFLCKEFSNIKKSTAEEIILSLGSSYDENMDPHDLSQSQIHRLTQVLRRSNVPPPSGNCLSGAGEYNLRLGIFKELQPDMVSTFSSAVHVHEGHPFMVEVGVALGGKDSKVVSLGLSFNMKGITVYRFANRIPLLYEGSNDVVTKVANLKIKWSSYKMRPKQDKIGVFVSIVSTRIPFKGTSKEYIGDDKEGGVLHETVKKSITNCCKQLRRKIQSNATIKEQEDRKKNLGKYIPNVANSIANTLKMMVDDKFTPERPLDCLLMKKLVQTPTQPRDIKRSLEAYIHKVCLCF